MSAVAEFHTALQSVFGQLDWLPIGDGEIHRFHVHTDKRGRLNGWYVLYLDGIASGAFGSWRSGTSGTWSSREPVNLHEAQQIRQRIEQAKRQREAEQRQRNAKAARIARHVWGKASKANAQHPYLIAKGVKPYNLRQLDGELLVPLYADGELVNLQGIDAQGTKRFLYGGRVKGAYSPIGRIIQGQPICICEGWATGATLHQSGYAVACAMNAGNLLPVALALRAKYPEAQIVIAGDDDRQSTDNVGRTKANEAAIACGGLAAFPDWPENAPLSLSDFNDLAQWSRQYSEQYTHEGQTKLAIVGGKP